MLDSPEEATTHSGKVGSGGHSVLLDLIRLSLLMDRTSGVAEIKIGLIDGPVATEHSALNAESLKEISAKPTGGCSDVTSMACVHGTFVAGMLSGKRGSAALGICPGCELLVRPIFTETSSERDQVPSATPTELTEAIFDVVRAGARVINLSVALIQQSALGEADLWRALDHTARESALWLRRVATRERCAVRLSHAIRGLFWSLRMIYTGV